MNTYFLTDIAILERVGAKIKARRIASRLTQKQLATDAGVSHSALCSLEAGKNTSSHLPGQDRRDPGGHGGEPALHPHRPGYAPDRCLPAGNG